VKWAQAVGVAGVQQSPGRTVRRKSRGSSRRLAGGAAGGRGVGVPGTLGGGRRPLAAGGTGTEAQLCRLISREGVMAGGVRIDGPESGTARADGAGRGVGERERAGV
jgi:hypothetical protein